MELPAYALSMPPAIVLRVADQSRPKTAAGRGGKLLPAGYLHTQGSQIVDNSGNFVRIASIGWHGTDGLPGNAPSGLWHASFTDIMDAIVAAGFNTVRIPWTDVSLNLPFDGYEQHHSWINTELNKAYIANAVPDANGHVKFITALQGFKLEVDYAGKIGLKVIFDHHSNEGVFGQQKNGLWFDLGPGTDGTDGAVPGKVTFETFKANWLTLARTFAGNATVIGYDLHNEPNGTHNAINWGSGGSLDIKAMCENVGTALQAVDPGPLIICEGPEEYRPPSKSSGMDPNIAAPAGDLTAAGRNPVVLPVRNKLVYSVHEYPTQISDIARSGLKDYGPEFVERMNRSWGYLVRDHIAPVWIGEMGSSMRAPNERDFARTLLNYMDGKYGASGGPVFIGKEQPISGSWWVMGYSEDTPYGIQTRWGKGNYRPEQLEITDQMLMRRNN